MSRSIVLSHVCCAHHPQTSSTGYTYREVCTSLFVIQCPALSNSRLSQQCQAGLVFKLLERDKIRIQETPVFRVRVVKKSTIREVYWFSARTPEALPFIIEGHHRYSKTFCLAGYAQLAGCLANGEGLLRRREHFALCIHHPVNDVPG